MGMTSPGTLSRAPLAGGAPRELLDNVIDADWTPDGSELAVVRQVWGPKSPKYVVEFPMGHGVFETHARIRTIRVSPKGDRVALGGHVSGQEAVSVVDRSGAATTLSKGWLRISGLAWPPGGDEVWFTAARAGGRESLPAVWAVSLSGRERLLARAPIGYQMNDIFHDGRVLLGVDNSRVGLLCRAPGEEEERELGWLGYSWIEDLSPDGRTLLFAAGETGRGPRDSTPSVYLRGMDGSPAVRLGDGHPARLSPDGQWVLAARADYEEWFLLPTRAGRPRKLPRGAIAQIGGGDWLDGGRIVLWGREEGHGTRFYVQDLEQGTIRPITPDGVKPPERVVLTPDRRAVLAFAREAGKWSLYSVDGGDPRPMPFLDRADEPVQWSADARFLYVVPRGESVLETAADVHRLDVATGRRELFKTLSPPDPAGVQWIERVVLTPDGRSYCYTYTQTLASLHVVEGLK